MPQHYMSCATHSQRCVPYTRNNIPIPVACTRRIRTLFYSFCSIRRVFQYLVSQLSGPGAFIRFSIVSFSQEQREIAVERKAKGQCIVLAFYSLRSFALNRWKVSFFFFFFFVFVFALRRRINFGVGNMTSVYPFSAAPILRALKCELIARRIYHFTSPVYRSGFVGFCV